MHVFPCIFLTLRASYTCVCNLPRPYFWRRLPLYVFLTSPVHISGAHLCDYNASCTFLAAHDSIYIFLTCPGHVNDCLFATCPVHISIAHTVTELRAGYVRDGVARQIAAAVVRRLPVRESDLKNTNPQPRPLQT